MPAPATWTAATPSAAHLAQGATVDRDFVLGSEELYREWGYTALSRHRKEARFFVSATPAFLNRSTVPLTAAADPTREAHRTRWYERAARRELERRIGGLGATASALAERLTREVDARRVPAASQLSQAIDPLSGIEPRARDLAAGVTSGSKR